MEVFNFELIRNEVVNEEGSKNTKIRWLITRKIGASNFEMRLFEVEQDGYTPFHKHNWEHEVFILEGEGIVRSDSKEIKVKPGSVVFVQPNELHQFINAGQNVLRFICVIPTKR